GHIPLQILSFWIILLLLGHVTAGYGLADLIDIKWYWVIGVLLSPLVIRLARSESVQRALVPDQDQELEVLTRAQLEFELNRVDKTHASTGVLIFISLM